MHESRINMNKKEIKASSVCTPKMIVFQHVIYVSGILYSFFKFYSYCQSKKKMLLFSGGNSYFGMYNSDDAEYSTFKPLLLELAPFGLLHLVLSQTLKCIMPDFLEIFYITFSFIALLKFVGVFSVVLYVLAVSLMFAVSIQRSKAAVWMTWFACLMCLNCEWFSDYMVTVMTQDNVFITSVSLAWLLLRCISFCVTQCERIDDRLSLFESYITFLAYSFYFPNFFFGPFFCYEDYYEGIKKPFETWDLKRITWFLLQCLRYSAWIFMIDSLLSYFYINLALFSPSVLVSLDSWTLSGYYLCCCTFFYMKYVVFYGMPCVISRAEGIETPHHPRCPFWYTSFSDCWRYFDPGLHKFMVRYIYFPLIGRNANWGWKLCASFIVFSFVFVWHGTQAYIFYWCLINYLLTLTEKAASVAVTTEVYCNFKRKVPKYVTNSIEFMCAGFMMFVSLNSLLIFVVSPTTAWVVFHLIIVKGFPVTTFATIYFFSLLPKIGSSLRCYVTQKS